MKRLFSFHTLLLMLPTLLGIGVLASACNSTDEDTIDYETAASVAVTKFTISPNARVMENLDSVYFSIDLARGIIFNADSLPMGTPVDRLVPVITYPTSVVSATIEMTGGQTREGTVNYIENPTDTIDFTGDVTLRLATADDALTRTYRLKVNVHKSAPDSLMWDKIALSTLPSRSASPQEQKSVQFNGKVISLIKENDGSLTLSSCSNPADANWTRTPLSLPFQPTIRSLAATDDALYILDANGSLMSSTDGLSWSATSAPAWHTIIGGFGNTLLGIAGDATSGYLHDQYPRAASFSPSLLEDDFPTEGLSDFHSFSSKWADDPIGFFCGGLRNGTPQGHTWAYDGNSWAKISHTPLPAMSETLIIPYYNYRKTNTSWIQTEFSVWLCFGGRLADGSINPDIYLSYDNGVNWQKASSLLQLPTYITPLCEADAAICTTPMSAELDAYWKSYSSKGLPAGATRDVRRISYAVDGTDVDWECPYIYLIGGRDASGTLQNAIWRAVLARLTYAPLF